MRLLSLLSVPVLALALLGCGSNSPVAVKGTVTLDDVPLKEGRVSFILPGQVPILMDVKDGAFSGSVKPAEYRVEIAAYRPYQIPADVPKSMHSLMADGKENYLPKRYHSESILKAGVDASGANSFDFPLTSREK